MKKMLSISLLLLLASMLTLTTFPTAKAQHAPITIDADPTDWTGTAPATNTWAWSEGEWIWTDEAGDDTGNGTYTYPTATKADGGPYNWNGSADLTEFRMTWDSSNVSFLITLVNVEDANWVQTSTAGWLSDPIQAETTALVICIDTDLAAGSGMDLVGDGATPDGISAGVYLPNEALWEYLIEIELNDVVLWAFDGLFINEAVRNFPVAADNATYETIECSIPIDPTGAAGLPDPEGQAWRLFVLLGTQDFEHFREVVAGPAQMWLGGGGADHQFDPRVYDCAFFATKADQEAALNGFTDADYATLPFGTPLGPSWRAIPEFPLPFGFALIAIVVLAVSFKMRKKLYT